MDINVLNHIVKIPDCYQKVESLPEDPQNSTTCMFQSPNALCMVQIFPIPEEAAMPYLDKQAVIDGIHRCLADNQGLVQIQHGWIYSKKRFMASIVKTLKEENGHPAGVQYTLTMHAKWDKNSHICIFGYFDEMGVTGQREAIMYETARRDGEFDMSTWSADPYDPDFKKGVLCNLSEDYHYDEFFPQHPLTLCRDLITHIIRNN